MAKRSSADSWMWAIVLGAIALVVGLAVLKGRHEVSGLEGKAAPKVTLQLLEGGKLVDLPAKDGKVVMLDFWATWCGPCKATMPVVQKVWRDYKDRGVELYAVNTDRSGNDREPSIREFLLVNRVQVPVALDGEDNAVQAAYNVASLPTLVVLDRAGRVTWSHVGNTAGWERELRSTLDAALARASN